MKSKNPKTNNLRVFFYLNITKAKHHNITPKNIISKGISIGGMMSFNIFFIISILLLLNHLN